MNAELESFYAWYSTVGHWIYDSLDAAKAQWIEHGIEGLPKPHAEHHPLMNEWEQ